MNEPKTKPAKICECGHRRQTHDKYEGCLKLVCGQKPFMQDGGRGHHRHCYCKCDAYRPTAAPARGNGEGEK